MIKFGFALIAACTIALSMVSFGSAEQNASDRVESLKRFGQVLDIVSRYYVKEKPSSELVDGAIKGMLQSLDAHSTMMTPKEFKDLQDSTNGEFSGIGIEITQENNQLIVVTPIDGTPAFKAGLKPGDVILKINNESTHGMSLNDAVSRIRGKKGSPVSLTVLHKNSSDPYVAQMRRDTIPLKSVSSRQLEPGYYWIRISRFSGKTTEELHNALKSALDESTSVGVKGVILDIRSNPGGLLDAAIGVSDTFLPKGNTIVSVRTRDVTKEQFHKSNDQRTDVTYPLVVLVNSGSASASEIVAAALSDNKRAIIVGEPTFGKGSVQNLIPMSDGSGIKLTIAMYYTPSGKSIQNDGVQPDVLIPYETPHKDPKAATISKLSVRERDLTKHLEKPDGKENQDTKQNEKMEETIKILEQDNQLRLSLQLVKSLPKFSSLK